jgi:hypothetical protein
MSTLAVALTNTQVTTYATAATLIPLFGFAFVLGETVNEGLSTWIRPARIAVYVLFAAMVAGEAVTLVSLLADRYWPAGHAVVAAGIGAAAVGLLIEAAIQLHVLGKPGSQKYAGRTHERDRPHRG